jgi:hypothetical protein
VSQGRTFLRPAPRFGTLDAPPLPHHGGVEILLWLVPAAVTTGLAALYVSWVGRERGERELTEADQERFAAAIMRPLPGQAPARGSDSTRRAS